MFAVYVTGHRGMGVTAKRRDHFIRGARFFPENSIAAFKEAIKIGAEALECDIHVSQDRVPIVIHGSKITDYAYYIGNKGKMFENDENKTCESLTVLEIKENFALKTFECPDKPIKNWENSEKEQAFQHYSKSLASNPDLYKIPTLEQLLELVSDENGRRISSGDGSLPLIKLNIELKGKDAGFLTLATIADFHEKRAANRTYAIDCKDIILLGRMAVGEIAIAKGLLKGANQFLRIKDGILRDEKKQHDELSLLFGEREIETFLNNSGWALYLTKNPCPNEEHLPNSFPSKAIILTANNNVFLVKEDKSKKKKFFKKGTGGPFGFQVKINQDIQNGFTTNDLIKAADIIKFDIDQLVYDIIEQIRGIPTTFCDIPQDYRHGKILERIATAQTNNMHALGNLKERQLAVLTDFLRRIIGLNNIRTNLMLSTGELYDESALALNTEDFDVRSDISRVPLKGYQLVRKCFQQGYDGVDISLFDFDEVVIQAITEEMGQARSTDLIIGVTASNWKGVLSEKSPISPGAAVLNAMRVSHRLKIPVLMKVDEPQLFRTLKDKIKFSEIVESKEETVLADFSEDVAESQETLIESHQFMVVEISTSILDWLQSSNYDISIPNKMPSVLNRSAKPPRGAIKKNNGNLEEACLKEEKAIPQTELKKVGVLSSAGSSLSSSSSSSSTNSIQSSKAFAVSMATGSQDHAVETMLFQVISKEMTKDAADRLLVNRLGKVKTGVLKVAPNERGNYQIIGASNDQKTIEDVRKKMENAGVLGNNDSRLVQGDQPVIFSNRGQQAACAAGSNFAIDFAAAGSSALSSSNEVKRSLNLATDASSEDSGAESKGNMSSLSRSHFPNGGDDN